MGCRSWWWTAVTATVVDGRGETPVMIDGPDLDVALGLAAEASRACRGKVEVRPFDGLACVAPATG